jgi:hypothetical protein
MDIPGSCICNDPMVFRVGTLVFSWSGPQTDTPITTYELQIVQEGAVPITIQVVPEEDDVTIYQVSNLIPGIVVDAAVRASNDNGNTWGPYTSFPPATPINIPVDPPASITATMDPDTLNVTVTWTAPAVEPLGLAYFYVESVANSPYVPIYGLNTADLSVFTYTFTQLNCGFSYYFQVRVTNNAGQSPAAKTTEAIEIPLALTE